MKAEQLSDVLAYLDDDLLIQTNEIRRNAQNKKKTVYFGWQQWGTLVACICLLIIGSTVLSTFKGYYHPGETAQSGPTMVERPRPTSEQTTTEVQPTSTVPTEATAPTEVTTPPKIVDNDLPSLYIDAYMGTDGQGGSTTILVADLEEWMTSPWSKDDTPGLLPVYDNGLYDHGHPYGLNHDEMEDWVYRIVGALNTELISMKYTPYRVTDKDITGKVTATGLSIGYIEAQTEIADIYIDGRDIQIIIKEWFEEDALYPQINGFIDQFVSLLNFIDPQTVDKSRSKDNPSERHELFVYDAAGDGAEDLLNYQYNRVEFSTSAVDGELYEIQIRICNGLSTMEKLGDYPTVSVEEATELLINGHFFAAFRAADEDLIKQENIAGVELIYPRSIGNEIIIPYYCFYIAEETDPTVDSEFTGYRLCYVPAIDPEYIENLPSYTYGYDGLRQ